MDLNDIEKWTDEALNNIKDKIESEVYRRTSEKNEATRERRETKLRQRWFDEARKQFLEKGKEPKEEDEETRTILRDLYCECLRYKSKWYKVKNESEDVYPNCTRFRKCWYFKNDLYTSTSDGKLRKLLFIKDGDGEHLDLCDACIEKEKYKNQSHEYLDWNRIVKEFIHDFEHPKVSQEEEGEQIVHKTKKQRIESD
jgi:hypothetical protein